MPLPILWQRYCDPMSLVMVHEIMGHPSLRGRYPKMITGTFLHTKNFALNLHCLLFLVIRMLRIFYNLSHAILALVKKSTYIFLDASSHLYKRVCPSVGPSVGPSVRYASSNIMQMTHLVARSGLLKYT